MGTRHGHEWKHHLSRRLQVVTAMLKLIRQDLLEPEVSILVESPVPGVVLIDAVLGRPEAPLHWRAGLWNKPPLDVSLVPNGRLAAVQFVLQDERVPRSESLNLSWDGTGGIWPVFDVGSWPDGRYLDEEIAVSLERMGDLLVLGVGAAMAQRWECVGNGLAIGLNGSDEVVVLVPGPLGAEDWDAIDTFSSVA